MKYAIFILSLLFGMVYAQTANHYSVSQYDLIHPATATTKADTLVYVCNSSGAYRYHGISTCRGYQQCKHTEDHISISEARKRKYTPCLICKP